MMMTMIKLTRKCLQNIASFTPNSLKKNRASGFGVAGELESDRVFLEKLCSSEQPTEPHGFPPSPHLTQAP